MKTWRDTPVLRRLAREANFKLVRFFNHRLGAAAGSGSVPCSSWDETTQTGVWDGWEEIDALIQRIFEIEAEPLICFGYYSPSLNRLSVPTNMATDNDGLPRAQTWANYCVEWLHHFRIKGFPVRYFEIVNEPYQYFGWTNMAKLANYVDFWNTVSRAMRKENPNVLISQDASTLKAVMDYWIIHGDDIDFLDFHKYDSPISGRDATDAEVLQRAETNYFAGTSNVYSVRDAREKWRAARFRALPVILGETNLSWKFSMGTDPRIQQILGAVHSALVLRKCILENIRYTLYWEFHDSGSAPENQPGRGFGLVNTDDGRPWYPYYIQQWIGRNLSPGDQIMETTSSSEDIRTLAWTHNAELRILLINKTDLSKNVTLRGIEGRLDLLKVDNTIEFTNPSPQTGTINCTDPLQLNGYTVILLQKSQERESNAPTSS